ncbi:hypothetical protein KVV02_006542 [Mortierella alpina]|uniref:Uncharacterized protein n=1 Tax=Mortierella alpina TaxID=64518 RepID=A0A9P8A2Z2_MORAP|nr:hypothetical protein KVV02_006542 [Mortierella alpina]
MSRATMASTSMALSSLAPYSYTLSPTESAATWLEECGVLRAAEAQTPQAALARVRLEQAYSCQELHQERIHEALSSLRNKGLIVAPSQDIVFIPVPSRIPSLISFLAQTFAVNINIFSSRSLPVLFKNNVTSPSFGLFHKFDPILGVCDFVVLTLPPTPPPISPSPAAWDELGDKEVVLAFKKSWQAEEMPSRDNTTEDPHSIVKEQGQRRSSTSLYVRKDVRLPPGVKLTAFENIRQSNENAKGLPNDVLSRKLGSEGFVKSWNARVDQDFDDVWAEEEKVQSDMKAKKKEAKKKAKEIDGPNGDDGYDSDDDDGSGSKKRNLRTCTANLQGSILRMQIKLMSLSCAQEVKRT